MYAMRERERERGSQSWPRAATGKKCAALKIVDTLELLRQAATVPGQAKERERTTLLAKSSAKRRHCHMGDHTRSLRPGCSATGNLGHNTEGTTVVLRLVTLHSLCTAPFPLPPLLPLLPSYPHHDLHHRRQRWQRRGAAPNCSKVSKTTFSLGAVMIFGQVTGRGRGRGGRKASSEQGRSKRNWQS